MISDLSFSLVVYILLAVGCSVIFLLLHLPGKKVPQTKGQDLGRKLLRGFSWLFLIATSFILLMYNLLCCDHVLFFKMIWAVLLFAIVFVGWAIAEYIWIKEPSTGWPYKWNNTPLTDDRPLAKAANYSISKKKSQQLASNPIVRKAVDLARRLDAAAILCEPTGIKIYSAGTISPMNRRVFLTSDDKDDSNVTHSGEDRKKDYYQNQFDRWFYVQEKPDLTISFYAENFPSMAGIDQKNFSAVVAQQLGDRYMILEHTGTLSWDTTKKEWVSGGTTYHPVASGGFRSSDNGREALKGNSGSVSGFYTSIVKKELASACEENAKQQQMRKTLLDRQQASNDLARQTNKW
ncbi:MAG: hypothetical protein ACI4GO_02190 [Hominenteromicrobium sp.]